MHTPKTDLQQYEIRIKGQLEPRWANRFEGMTITLEESGDTLLSGPLADQSALHGVLKFVRDLGLTLLSVNQKPAHLPENPVERK